MKGNPMPQHPLPLTGIVHENLSILMMFAFSRQPLLGLRKKFVGNWQQLDHVLFTIAEQRAIRACLELAILMRHYDDIVAPTRLPDDGRPRISFGRLFTEGKPEKTISHREVSNKIIHSSRYEWDFSDPEIPALVCIAQDTQKWDRAVINVVHIAAYCGTLTRI